jgi:glycosyltransferase involved in cell wall biosynthesis
VSAAPGSEDRPSVAVVLPNLDAGGAEIQLVQLASFLAQRGWPARIVCLDARGVLAERVPSGLTVTDLGVRSARRAIPLLAKTLAAEADAVVVSSLKHVSLAVEAARRLGRAPARHLVRVANTYSRELGRAGFLRRSAWRSSLRWLHRSTDATVCGSEGVRRDLVALTGIDPARVRVIHNPVFDAALLRRAAEPAQDAELERHPGTKLVGAGRLEPQKGFDVLVAAFAAAFRGQAATLFVLGEGRERERLRALASELGVGEQVRLPGFVANPYPYFARCDAFVLSSRYEGLPNVLIEALCLGCSVVATDCASGPREIVEAVGAGRLVPVDDGPALAEALRAAAGDTPPGAAIERARALFDREARLTDYAHAIERLAGLQSGSTQPLVR